MMPSRYVRMPLRYGRGISITHHVGLNVVSGRWFGYYPTSWHVLVFTSSEWTPSKTFARSMENPISMKYLVIWRWSWRRRPTYRSLREHIACWRSCIGSQIMMSWYVMGINCKIYLESTSSARSILWRNNYSCPLVWWSPNWRAPHLLRISLNPTCRP